MTAPAVLDASGAFSRAALDARLAAERHALRETGAPAALVVLEVDADGSDAIVAGVAERLRERHRCWPYRVSQRAFVVLLPGGDEPAGAELAEIIRASVAIRPIAQRAVTVSVGVAASPSGWGWDDATLGTRADAALRRAQAEGGNVAVAHGLGIVTPDEERPTRGRRLAAPHAEVVHRKPSWWSVLTQRDPDPDPDTPLPMVPVAPDASTVAAGLPVVDGVSQALTRSALEWRAAELAHRARQNGLAVALVVAGLDRFAAVDGRFGPPAGDEVLREIAHRIEAQAPRFVCPYRVADDAFAVLLVGDEARRAFALAERVRGAVAAASAGALVLSASVGVAAAAPGTFDLDHVARRALAAQNAAREGGGDQVRVDGAPAAPPAPGTPRTLRAA